MPRAFLRGFQRPALDSRGGPFARMRPRREVLLTTFADPSTFPSVFDTTSTGTASTEAPTIDTAVADAATVDTPIAVADAGVVAETASANADADAATVVADTH